MGMLYNIDSVSQKQPYHVRTEQTALSMITVNNYNGKLVQGTIKKGVKLDI